MLSSKQRSRLAGIAQTKDCLIALGRAGMSPELVERLSVLLAQHELVKLRFGALGESEGAKPRERKAELAAALAEGTGSELVRIIGNIAVFWKRSPDPEKRTIEIE